LRRGLLTPVVGTNTAIDGLVDLHSAVALLLFEIDETQETSALLETYIQTVAHDTLVTDLYPLVLTLPSPQDTLRYHRSHMVAAVAGLRSGIFEAGVDIQMSATHFDGVHHGALGETDKAR
jgi:hypothetical protein